MRRQAGTAQASLETRIWQLKRVMDFPHAGDLWLISTVYPDGTVAALEELIGNHGGLGGEQTDAFVFHPADMAVTRDAQRHRRLPHPQQPPRQAGS